MKNLIKLYCAICHHSQDSRIAEKCNTEATISSPNLQTWSCANQPELLAMTDSSLQKLKNISDAEFAELALYPDF